MYSSVPTANRPTKLVFMEASLPVAAATNSRAMVTNSQLQAGKDGQRSDGVRTESDMLDVEQPSPSACMRSNDGEQTANDIAHLMMNQ